VNFNRQVTHFPRLIVQTLFVFVNDRVDICIWDSARDTSEFDKNSVLGNNASPSVKAEIIFIIHLHWDYFYSKGTHNPILGL
jgi:hypothetical protein